MLKSIWSVVAGVLVIIILSIVTDLALEGAGFFPRGQGLFNPLLLVVSLAYRTFYASFGGYVTAKLAPSNKEKHVIALLIVGTIFGILGVIGGWNLSQHWYPISLVITSAIAVWLGGKLQMQKKK
jgi:hypothetical protein